MSPRRRARRRPAERRLSRISSSPGSNSPSSSPPGSNGWASMPGLANERTLLASPRLASPRLASARTGRALIGWRGLVAAGPGNDSVKPRDRLSSSKSMHLLDDLILRSQSANFSGPPARRQSAAVPQPSCYALHAPARHQSNTGGMSMFFRQILHEDLGCASYVIAARGEAAVVDPKWEIGEYLQAADEAGAKIRHVLETHFHADHASGRQRLAVATGARSHLPVDPERQAD